MTEVAVNKVTYFICSNHPFYFPGSILPGHVLLIERHSCFEYKEMVLAADIDRSKVPNGKCELCAALEHELAQ